MLWSVCLVLLSWSHWLRLLEILPGTTKLCPYRGLLSCDHYQGLLSCDQYQELLSCDHYQGLLSCAHSKGLLTWDHCKGLFLKTMPPLLLSNNLTRLRKDKNLCFVNSCLQVLFAIEEIRDFFQAVDAEDFPSSWPVSKELCRIFASDGNYEISAANFRR